jgi:hypothetical protein
MRVQFAIGRLLARLGMAQPQQWIAKGGTSLLARFDGRCRLSRDLDLQRRDLQEIGMSALTDAAAVDGADWLTYRIGQPSALRQVDVFGLKVRATALLDRRDFATFDVDMVERQLRSAGSNAAGRIFPSKSPVRLPRRSRSIRSRTMSPTRLPPWGRSGGTATRW